MRFPRASGILLHITSLPGQFGVGDLGANATEFLDFLESSGQQVWQVLPLGPPALGDSPYSCYSAFAGNRLLISPSQMVADGWLRAEDAAPLAESESPENLVDFKAAVSHKQPQFEKAFDQSKSKLISNESFSSFCNENALWLKDFARFEAMMEHFQESNWTRWPRELVCRDESALSHWDGELEEQILFSKFLQFVFDQQWKRVKEDANSRGIRIFGDMPIFVAHQSADVWANQNLFCLNEMGEPSLVAGVPPDYFSETGQLWGNPLYRWDVLESTNYQWWTDRFDFALRQFDLLRVDHFRGFEAYWEIPASAETAMGGQWIDGPKSKPFDAAREKLGELPIVAEDLGMITQAVHDLRDQLGFPAMRVMQFGFDNPDDVFHHPEHYPEHSVAYTGTHDNDTLMGWVAKHRDANPDNRLVDELIKDDSPVHLQLVKSVLESGSDTAIIPMQDLLGLGNEARMNLPGEADGNWSWRVSQTDLTQDLSAHLNQMTKNACR